MSYCLRYLLRHFRKNVLSGIFEIVSLMIAVAVLYLTLNSSGDVLLTAEEAETKVTGGFDVCFLSKDSDGCDPYATDFGEGSTILPIRFRNETTESVSKLNYCLTVCADLPELCSRGLITVKEGSLPTSENEVAVTAMKSEYFSLSVGDRISLKDDKTGEEREAKIVCILSDATIFGNDRPDLLEMMGIFPEGAKAHHVYVELKSGVDAEKFAKDFDRVHQADWKYELMEDRHDLSPIRRILGILIGATVLLAVAVIATVSSLRLETRLADFAVFRSVGATSGILRFLLLVESLIYGAAGGLLGIGLGEVFRVVFIRHYFAANAESRAFHPLFLLCALAFAVLIRVSVTAVCSRRLFRGSVRSAMLDRPSASAKPGVVPFLIGVFAFIAGAVLHFADPYYDFYLETASLVLSVVGVALFLPFLTRAFSRLLSRAFARTKNGTAFLAARNLGANRSALSGVRLTSLVVALCSIVIFTVTSVKTYFDEYIKTYDFDLYIRGTDLTDEECDFALGIKGVASLKKEYWKRRRVTVEGKTENYYVCFVKKNGYLSGITMRNCDEQSLAPGEAILDEIYAKINGISIGDSVTFLTETNEDLIGKPLSVVGFCDSGIYNSSRQTVILSDEDFLSNLRSTPMRIDITLEEGVSVEDMMKKLGILSYLHIDRDISVGTSYRCYGEELERTNSALAVFSLVPLFSIVLAIFGLANERIVTFREKKREYAVLYSVAMSRRQLYWGLILENTLIYLIGAAVGVAVGFYFIGITQSIVYSQIAYVAFEVHPAALIGLLLTAGATVFGASAAAYSPVFRMRMVDSLRGE